MKSLSDVVNVSEDYILISSTLVGVSHSSLAETLAMQGVRKYCYRAVVEIYQWYVPPGIPWGRR